MKKERLNWFENYKAENELDSKTMIHFHKTEGQGNDDYGIVMDRQYVKTTSITQVEKTNAIIKMRFNNLQTNQSSIKSFQLSQTVNE